MTVFAALYLAALPLIEKWRPGRGAASPFEIVTPLIDLTGAFLPSFAKPWLDAFRHSPGRFVIGLLVMALLMWIGGWMQTHIRDLMRTIWKQPTPSAERDNSWIHRLRSAGPYRAFFYVLKHWILPALFAAVIFVVLLYAGFCLLSRASFMVFDVTGHVCTPAAPAVPVTAKSEFKGFETKALCAPTGLAVNKGSAYEVVRCAQGQGHRNRAGRLRHRQDDREDVSRPAVAAANRVELVCDDSTGRQQGFWRSHAELRTRWIECGRSGAIQGDVQGAAGR
jgi:hypothetical protein